MVVQLRNRIQPQMCSLSFREPPDSGSAVGSGARGFSKFFRSFLAGMFGSCNTWMSLSLSLSSASRSISRQVTPSSSHHSMARCSAADVFLPVFLPSSLGARGAPRVAPRVAPRSAIHPQHSWCCSRRPRALVSGLCYGCSTTGVHVALAASVRHHVSDILGETLDTPPKGCHQLG